MSKHIKRSLPSVGLPQLKHSRGIASTPSFWSWRELGSVPSGFPMETRRVESSNQSKVLKYRSQCTQSEVAKTKRRPPRISPVRKWPTSRRAKAGTCVPPRVSRPKALQKLRQTSETGYAPGTTCPPGEAKH